MHKLLDIINNPNVLVIAAAVIGGLCSISGSYLATRKQIKQSEKDKKITSKRFIDSIYTEITSIYSRYQELSIIIESSNDFLEFYMYINEDYFPIYHNNIGYIGLIDNDELRNSIIDFYTQAKGLIDTIRTNTKLLEELRSCTIQSKQYTIHHTLRNYLATIKEDNAKTLALYNKIQKLKQ